MQIWFCVNVLSKVGNEIISRAKDQGWDVRGWEKQIPPKKIENLGKYDSIKDSPDN